MHEAWPKAPCDLPALHSVHSVVSPREYLPASQAVHSVADVSLFVKEPAEHSRQSSFTAVGAYFPNVHPTHSEAFFTYCPLPHERQ